MSLFERNPYTIDNFALGQEMVYLLPESSRKDMHLTELETELRGTLKELNGILKQKVKELENELGLRDSRIVTLVGLLNEYRELVKMGSRPVGRNN